VLFYKSLWAQIGPTPVSNTGLKWQNASKVGPDLTVKIDTFAGICRNVPDLSTAYHIINLLEQAFDDRVEFRPDLSGFNGRRWDGTTISSLRGLRFWWDSPKGSTPGQLFFTLGGKVLAAATYKEIHDVLGYLFAAFNLEAKRLDIALDDYAKSIEFDEVEDAIRGGNFAYFRKSKKVEGLAGEGRDLGNTIYCGSTSGNKLVRYYNKAVESEGEIDAYRWEVQFRDEHAQTIFSHWAQVDPAEAEAKGPQFLSSMVTGSVHFCDRSVGDGHIDRCPVLGWWAQLLDRAAQGVRLAISKKQPLLERTLEWLNRQVFPQMAVVKKVFGQGFSDYFEAELAGGESRHGSRHRAIIELARKEGWLTA
jgi:hypothetical protein